MVLLKLRNRVRMAENGVKLNMKAAPFIQRLIGKGQSSVSSNECFDFVSISAAEDQPELCMSVHAS